MTKEEIIRLVKKTDLLGIIDSQYYDNELWIFDVMEFAKLIAEKEREKCAKVIDAEVKETGLCAYYANLIRAKGQE
jgi:hypothetical protein